jgi:hypothetical protein
MRNDRVTQTVMRIIDMMFCTMFFNDTCDSQIMTMAKFWKKMMSQVCIQPACDPMEPSRICIAIVSGIPFMLHK